MFQQHVLYCSVVYGRERVEKGEGKGLLCFPFSGLI